MEPFNYKKFIIENKLTKASIIIESAKPCSCHTKVNENTESVKLTKASLKQKIKEMIVSEMENSETFPDDDYEKLSREVEANINPYSGEDAMDGGSNSWKDEMKDMGQSPEDTDSILARLNREPMDDLDEAKKKKKEEEDSIEDIDFAELDLGDEQPDDTQSIAAPSIDTSAVDPNIKSVQDALTQAQAAAEKIGDEKLTQQIGNTITMFTRTHIANKEQSNPAPAPAPAPMAESIKIKNPKYKL